MSDNVEEKQLMLRCQWQKRQNNNNWVGVEPKCHKCIKRFACLTIVPRRYKAIYDQTTWDEFEIIAESKGEAVSLWHDFRDDGSVVRLVKHSGESTNFELEEW